ncbi:hypothetical protein FVE85_3569 [Porphyridium purpureum]|uniref:Uncharacterized protein n=1 Tax=Porphyridium purpureum TaxID=35688 RepID=A0A5J4YKX8_PORPP|nr:hypothetical protein FVE85_3569 [Porphyridium purpureum]|eukprot:POR1809..scf249_10
MEEGGQSRSGMAELESNSPSHPQQISSVMSDHEAAFDQTSADATGNGGLVQHTGMGSAEHVLHQEEHPQQWREREHSHPLNEYQQLRNWQHQEELVATHAGGRQPGGPHQTNAGIAPFQLHHHPNRARSHANGPAYLREHDLVDGDLVQYTLAIVKEAGKTRWFTFLGILLAIVYAAWLTASDERLIHPALDRSVQVLDHAHDGTRPIDASLTMNMDSFGADGELGGLGEAGSTEFPVDAVKMAGAQCKMALPGLTLILPYRNQPGAIEENLEKWMAVKDVYRVILIDWSSEPPLEEHPLLQGSTNAAIDLGRLLILRVQDEIEFAYSRAYNLGVLFTCTEYMMMANLRHVVDEGIIRTLAPSVFDSAHPRTVALHPRDIYMTPHMMMSASYPPARDFLASIYILRVTLFLDTGGFNEHFYRHIWADADFRRRIGIELNVEQTVLASSDVNIVYDQAWITRHLYFEASFDQHWRSHYGDSLFLVPEDGIRSPDYSVLALTHRGEPQSRTPMLTLKANSRARNFRASLEEENPEYLGYRDMKLLQALATSYMLPRELLAEVSLVANLEWLLMRAYSLHTTDVRDLEPNTIRILVVLPTSSSLSSPRAARSRTTNLGSYLLSLAQAFAYAKEHGMLPVFLWTTGAESPAGSTVARHFQELFEFDGSLVQHERVMAMQLGKTNKTAHLLKSITNSMATGRKALKELSVFHDLPESPPEGLGFVWMNDQPGVLERSVSARAVRDALMDLVPVARIQDKLVERFGSDADLSMKYAFYVECLPADDDCVRTLRNQADAIAAFVEANVEAEEKAYFAGHASGSGAFGAALCSKWGARGVCFANDDAKCHEVLQSRPKANANDAMAAECNDIELVNLLSLARADTVIGSANSSYLLAAQLLSVGFMDEVEYPRKPLRTANTMPAS